MNMRSLRNSHRSARSLDDVDYFSIPRRSTVDDQLTIQRA
jgi:hypothetical protein